MNLSTIKVHNIKSKTIKLAFAIFFLTNAELVFSQDTIMASNLYFEPSAESHYNRGVKLVIDENYYEAIVEFDKALKLNVRFEKALLNRGIAYQEMKSFREALRDFDQLILLNANSDQAHFYRGLNHYYLDNIYHPYQIYN